MTTNYVATKTAVTGCKNTFEAKGYEVYRVRMECECHRNNNRRDGIIAIQGDKVIAKVMRCKGCYNREMNVSVYDLM